MVIKIDREICKGCELCIDVCPKGILELSDRTNAKSNHFVIAKDQDSCVGCCSCSTMCPEAAIELYR